MNPDLHIVLTGGGTGGHIIPALNLGREILRRFPDAKLLYLGSVNSLEQRLVDKEGWPFRTVKAVALRRGLYPSNLALPFIMLNSVKQALTHLSQFRADGVIGTGGYVSSPALAAARLAGRPYFLQEQNAYPGLVTRLFARGAQRIYLGHQEAVKYLKAAPGQILTTGNPISAAPCELSPEAARQHFKLAEERFTLFVTGGSGGSQKLNNTLAEALEGLIQRQINLIWQTGKYKPEEKFSGEPTLVGFLEKKISNVFITSLLDQKSMRLAYQAADLVVARAGAMTLAELAAAGRGAILAPYPFAAGNHQEINARTVEAGGAARVILNRNLDADILLQTIDDLRAKNQIPQMAEASARLAKPKAAVDIIDDLISTLSPH